MTELSYLLYAIDGIIPLPLSEQIVKIIISGTASLGGIPVELGCRRWPGHLSQAWQ